MMKIHKLVKHLSRIYHRVIDITIQSKTKFKLQKKNYVIALTNAQATIFLLKI